MRTRFDCRFFALFGLKAVDEDQETIALEGTFNECVDFCRRHGLAAAMAPAHVVRGRSGVVGRIVPADEDDLLSNEWVLGVYKVAIGIEPDAA